MKIIIVIFVILVQINTLFSQCDNFSHNFLWKPSCTSAMDYITTNTPKTYSPHPTIIWKEQGNQYAVLYNFDRILQRDPSWFPPSSRQVVVGRYSKEDLIPQLHSAKDKWLNVCSNPDVIWTYNAACGFYWGEDARLIGASQTSIVYFHFELPGTYKIVPINSQCKPNYVVSTQVIFNNTQEFYLQNPLKRWTTSTPQNDNQISFHSVALHIIGHYLGLADQFASGEEANYVMGGGLNKSIQIQQCEAKSYKLLYCPGELVSVEEKYPSYNPDDIDLVAFPNPGNSIVNISFKSDEKVPFSILLRDLHGSLVKVLNYELLSSNEYKSSFVISDIANGQYFLTVIIGSKSYTSIIVKQ